MKIYKYLGNFSAVDLPRSVLLCCDICKVKWDGCWDNYQCPQCGNADYWSDLMLRLGYYKEYDSSSLETWLI